MQKSAFTLSEALITLTVLGVIMALTITTLANRRPDTDKMFMKKAYSLTENIVNSLISDPLFYPDKTDYCQPVYDSLNCRWGFDDKTKVTYQGKSYESTTKFSELFMSKLNGSISGNTITTADGMKWDFSNIVSSHWTTTATPLNDTATNHPYVLIDVNGSKSPDCTYHATNCDSPDRFRIHIYSTGKMYIDPGDTTAIDAVAEHSKVNKQ